MQLSRLEHLKQCVKYQELWSRAFNLYVKLSDKGKDKSASKCLKIAGKYLSASNWHWLKYSGQSIRGM